MALDLTGVDKGAVRRASEAVETHAEQSKAAGGLRIERKFTGPGEKPLESIAYELRDSVITNPDGSVVFEMRGAEVPTDWSQLATDIAISKYFRKAGIHGDSKRGERSVKELVHRVAHTIREAGEKLGGYFASADDAETFEAELSYLLAHQCAAFNSPVWFNCGLFHRYGITGTGGNYAWHPQRDEIVETKNAYEHPQCSACFIQAIEDDLMSIYDLVKSEARLFKYGSGTGTNFSKIRGRQEKLSGGGTSSGLMSFLEVLDRAAGATKSGGTTRRAAKMVCLDMDHPEIVDFIEWKVKEEKKARALIEAGYDSDFNGDAYHTVSGQNSNNSIRVTDAFMKAVESDGEWRTYMRTTNQVCDTYHARDLWRRIAESAWSCADPGLQYDTTINDWHTCPNTDRINASNPCVTGDTLVATERGWARIDALLEKPTRVTGADGRLHEIEPAFKTGEKPVYRLRTRAGLELKLTADHKVLTANRGDVPACQLTKDDVLVLGRPSFGESELDEGVAEVVGLMLGDGCITGDQEQAVLTLSPDERAVAERAKAHLDRYRREHGADAREMRDITIAEQQGVLRLGTSARSVVNTLKQFAVLDEGSAKKRLTPAVFGLSKRAQAALLRGLFTADGTVASYGDKSHYVGLDSTSIELLREVQLTLLAFGIKAKLYRNRRVLGQTTALLPDGKGGTKEYPVDQIHSLRISRSSRVLFEREIGFVTGSPKGERLAELNRTVDTYEDRFEDRVASLELLGVEPVYDLTEPETHHFVAAGLVVHNCSEYMFLDNSACNLSSINLTKFLNEDGSFDVDGYRQAIRVLILAMEILVDFSAYPTKTIAQNSHDYRPLGLGYANLGTLLMRLGIPYDSDKGRAICGALTATLCGEAYATSALIAASKGPFPGFAANRQPMLRVMEKHRAAAYLVDEPSLPGMVEDRPAGCPDHLVRAARAAWDEAVTLGERHGYRNAQATVLAPTGTIGLLMDCDTTGIEPDFSLVKFKKLAGGGYFKIVNQSVPQALERLGYTKVQIADIVAYVRGTNTFTGAPHVNRKFLLEKGFTEKDVEKAEKALFGVFDVAQALAPWVLGTDVFERMGIPASEHGKPTFNMLRYWKLTQQQMDALSDVVVGRMTIEGAPHLREEHYAVFDCANRCGKIGKRFLEPMAHVRMMAAAQPFLSGAISKTVNLPNESTVEEVERIYREGWRLGLKAVALYRDGCKASQPLSSSGDEKKEKNDTQVDTRAASDVAVRVAPSPAQQAKGSPTTVRHRLPKKRGGFTQEARIGGHKVFLRTGEYENTDLGEIFIDMHKEGAAFRSLMNCFAISVSMGLQHGVPLSSYVDQFTFTRFEPQGIVEGHPNIKFATSIIDYVFRVLGVEYLSRYEFAQVPPKEEQLELENPTDVAAVARNEGLRVSEPPENLVKAEQAVFGFDGGGSEPASSLDRQLGEMMGDAPMCDTCGHITVRNGACYKCLNCGNSMGCS